MARGENQQEKFLNRFTARPPLIKKIEKCLKNKGLWGINIGFQEGLFLKSLCSLKQVRKVVEIGTQHGCSTTWMAMGLGKGGKVWTLEKDPLCVSQAQENFQDPEFLKLECQVEILPGPALENLKKLKKYSPFDLIFIDANKTSYPNYLHWAKENLNPGGMILADNIYLFGSLFEVRCPENFPKKMWQAMNRFLIDIFEDTDFETSIIPTTEGLLFAIKK